MAEREITLAAQYMTHSGGTKHYALFTLGDKSRNSAVGIQVWGENGKVSGTKFITGTTYQVDQQQVDKRKEKERVRKGEKYVAGVATSMDYTVSSAQANLKAQLARLGADIRRAEEICSEAFSKFGMSYAQAAQAEADAVVAKTKEERVASGSDYEGAWGAW